MARTGQYPSRSRLGVRSRSAQGRRQAIRAASASVSARPASAGSGAAGAAPRPPAGSWSIIWSASRSAANRNWRASDKVPRPARASRLLPSTSAPQCADFPLRRRGRRPVDPSGDRQVDHRAIRRPPPGSAGRARRRLRAPVARRSSSPAACRLASASAPSIRRKARSARSSAVVRARHPYRLATQTFTSPGKH